ncbi:uncharacterized protein PHALS_10792 [Plasmopara halstedii]|uniref:Uncharacterized protein n=1 Tax=Plasmopara halstedii TaxID=4781 RepID=A0A0P1AHM5_PLAHL|nr:uncharacterized protein PHALS_10792 [Plasmopara halstedii]CEG40606.1 hypothetical protein PHALS_10792 [Plasmopara halstedii]|eukprot:XP_024576975.1 hypothetical protein PHALS_10792 [Plasmopara halstedii]
MALGAPSAPELTLFTEECTADANFACADISRMRLPRLLSPTLHEQQEPLNIQLASKMLGSEIKTCPSVGIATLYTPDYVEVVIFTNQMLFTP